jgi:hypothetical protein
MSFRGNKTILPMCSISKHKKFMSSITKFALIGLMVIVYGIQMGHTVLNKVNWPFCSHNFYYHRSPLVKDLFRITLLDDQDNEIIVDPRHVLPIEGYRCGSIFREVFVKSDDLEKKTAFAKLILDRLNSGGWKRFDERFAPATPELGTKFINMSVEKHWIDTRQYSAQYRLSVIKKEVVFKLY